MSVRLFIGNLPYAATEAELREHLSSVGEPASVVLPVDRETGRPRGFAFVDYADRAVAEEAISRFDQQPFKGRPLAVSEARPREERARRAGRAGRFWRPAAAGRSGPAAAPAASRRGRAAGRRARRIRRSGTHRRAPRSRNFGPDAPPKHKRKPRTRSGDAAEGTDQGAPGRPPLRRRRRLAQREAGRSDIDDIATSAKVDAEGDQDDERNSRFVRGTDRSCRRT